MSDLLLDNLTGDLVIKDGDFVIVGTTSVVSDVRNSIKQDLKARLQFFLGEWFLDTLSGVPWFDEVFVKNPNMTIVDDLIKSVILNTAGVLGLEDFNMTYKPDERSFTVDFTARTTSGPLEGSEEIIIP